MAKMRRIERTESDACQGFSLIELMVVVAIGVIITAISFPAIRQIMRNYQLDSAGHEVASVLEAGRLAAVSSNQPYYVLYNQGLCVANAGSNLVCAVPATNSPNPPNGNNHTSADPTITTSSSVTFQTNNLPDKSQLDAYLGNVQPEVGTPIGFNSRGLPCLASIGSPFVCQQADPNAKNAIPGFEWFMRDGAQNYVAITVSPAGRIKSWHLATTKGGCGFPACWE